MEDSILQPEDSSSSANRSPKPYKDSDSINSPKEFDIKEVGTEVPTIETEQAGTIDLGKRLDPLEGLERLEKLRMRKFLTYSVLSLSIGWILIGLIHYLITGNSFLLIAVSPMSGPILIIMGYYFGVQLLQRQVHREP